MILTIPKSHRKLFNIHIGLKYGNLSFSRHNDRHDKNRRRTQKKKKNANNLIKTRIKNHKNLKNQIRQSLIT